MSSTQLYSQYLKQHGGLYVTGTQEIRNGRMYIHTNKNAKRCACKNFIDISLIIEKLEMFGVFFYCVSHW